MNFKDKIKELKPYDLNCNVFDVYSYNGLSMQELLSQFFTKINECIKISNDTIDLVSWLVNEGLPMEVANKLALWIEDGTLENIINVNLFNSLNTKIDNVSSQLEHIENEKMDINTTDISINQINKNKGKIDQTFLTDELISQITGTTPINSVNANYSITQEKMVVPYAECKTGKNLFNKNTVRRGVYVDYRNGNIIENEYFGCSQHIKVETGKTYISSDFNQVAFYDSNNNFVSGVNTNPFIIPPGVTSCVLSVKLSTIDTQQLEEGVLCSTYEDYKLCLKNEFISDDNMDYINNYLKEENKHLYPTLTYGKNLFNKDDTIKGKYIDCTNGYILDSDWFSYSDYIKVDENSNYTIHYFNQIAFYNSNKKFVGGLISLVNNTFKIPVGVKYIRIVTAIRDLNLQQLEKGTEKTDYENFKLKLDNRYIVNEDYNSITIKPSDNIIDVLLNNQGKTIYVSDGEYDVIKIYEKYFGENFFKDFTPNNAPRLHFGLPLTNGTKLICSPNAHFSCHYTGDNNQVKWRFSAFACGNGYELNGLNIDASNIQYAIHDDYNEYNDTHYYVKVENCCITNTNQAIGGGLGKYGTYEYKNNFIHATDSYYDMRYHNNKNDSRCKLSFVGNYFPNTLRLSYYGDSPKFSTKCFVSNNFISKPILNDAEDVNFTINNMKVYQWNNSSN